MVFFWMTIVLLNLIAFFIPKTLPRWQLYATSVFAVMFQLSVDTFFDLKLNLYGYFKKGVDNLGFIYEYGIFPAVSILFLTGWIWSSKKGLSAKIGYLIVSTLFATTFEHFAVQSNWFYYNGWKLWYSFIEYPILFLILISNLRILEWLHKRGRVPET